MNQTEQIGVRMSAWQRDTLEWAADWLPGVTATELARTAIHRYLQDLRAIGDPADKAREWLEKVQADRFDDGSYCGRWEGQNEEEKPVFYSRYMRQQADKYDVVRLPNGKPVDVKRRYRLRG